MAEGSGGSGNAGFLALSLGLIFGLIGLLVFFLLRMKADNEDEDRREGERSAAGGRRRRGQAEEDEDEDDDEAEEKPGRAKNAKREQRNQDRRERQEQNREVQQQKDEKNAKWQLKQQQKDAERQKKAAEEAKAKAEKERQDQEDFAKWKEMFSVEAECDDSAPAPEKQVDQELVEYVKLRKVVSVEDLAAQFRMRTAAAIDRLEQLEKVGKLSGIFDDRGKYICISSQEMTALAGSLQQKGRISRTELVASCSEFVRLAPTAEDQAKLDQQAATEG
eukprot:TRINITY_DN15892_c0_g2_i1.p1 TRINITY_DN15892_c0_g2~~TRINITY_DN15892_c0_g2_i1.p1  ORF type:complete len:288 (-),score=97.39 TRINITY_DN15892_c0_g2_i1:104-934(-)